MLFRSKVVKNTYGYKIPGEKTEQPRWEVTGSKGDKYYVTQTEHGLACTCSGFKFRSECKHVKSIKVEQPSTQAGTVTTSKLPIVADYKQINRRRTG